MDWLDTIKEIANTSETAASDSAPKTTTINGEEIPSWLANAEVVADLSQSDNQEKATIASKTDKTSLLTNRKDIPDWLANAEVVADLSQPNDQGETNSLDWLNTATYIDQEQQSVKTQTKPGLLSFNLRKALQNQGVDPDTLEVVDSAKNWGFIKKFIRSFGAGTAQFKMDMRMAQAAASDEDVYEEYKKDEEIYRRALAINPIESDNWFARAFYGAAQSAPGMAMSLAGKVAGSSVGLGVATAITALTPVPGDEMATGAVWLAKLFGKRALSSVIGTSAGALPFWLQGRGAIYREMREAGVDHDTAKYLSAAGGAVYASIEFINDYIPSRAIASAISGGFISKAAKPFVARSIAQALGKTAWQIGKSTLAEASEEFWQEISNSTFRNLGALLSETEAKPVEFPEMLSNAVAAFADAIGPSLVLGLAPNVAYGISQTKNAKAYDAITSAGVDETTAKYMVASFTGTEISEINKLATKDKNELLSKVIEFAQKRIGKDEVNDILANSADISRDDLNEILASPAPRLAYLAWQNDGIEGVREINKNEIFLAPDAQSVLQIIQNKKLTVKQKVEEISKISPAVKEQPEQPEQPVEENVPRGTLATQERPSVMQAEKQEETAHPKVEAIEATQPATQPVQPKTETAQPAQPKTEAAQPKTEAAQPKTEAAQPKTEAAQPKIEVAQSKTEVAQPSAQPVQPKAEAVEPVQHKALEPTPSNAEMAEKTETAKSARLVSKPVEITKPTAETIEITQPITAIETTKSGLEPVKPIKPTPTVAEPVLTEPAAIETTQPKARVKAKSKIAKSEPVQPITQEIAQEKKGVKGVQEAVKIPIVDTDIAQRIPEKRGEILAKDVVSETVESKKESDYAVQKQKTDEVSGLETPQVISQMDEKIRAIQGEEKGEKAKEKIVLPDTRLKEGEKPKTSRDLMAHDIVQWHGKNYIVREKYLEEDKVGLVSASSINDDEIKIANVKELTLKKRSVSVVVNKDVKKTFDKFTKKYPRVSNYAQALLDTLHISPAILDRVDNATLNKVAEELNAKVDIDNIAKEFEGAIVGLKEKDKLVLLGRLASPFAAAHEFYHVVFDILMEIPKYHDAVFDYFDRLFNSKDRPFAMWRESETGSRFIKENRKSFERGEINSEMREMLARLFEVCVAREGTEFDQRGRRRPHKHVSVLASLLDALPTKVQDAIRAMADLLALAWAQLNLLLRSPRKSILYTQIPVGLRGFTPLTELNRSLIGFAHIEASRVSEINDAREQLKPTIDRLRAEFLVAFNELYKKGLLPNVDEALRDTPQNKFLRTFKKQAQYPVTPEGYIAWMADTSARLFENMSINTMMLALREQQIKALQQIIIDIAQNATINAPHPSATTKVNELSEKPFMMNVMDIIVSVFARNMSRSVKRDEILSAIYNQESKIKEKSIPHYAGIIARNIYNEYGSLAGEIDANSFIRHVLAEMSAKLIPVKSIAALANFNAVRFSDALKLHPKDLREYSVVRILLEAITKELRSVTGLTQEQVDVLHKRMDEIAQEEELPVKSAAAEKLKKETAPKPTKLSKNILEDPAQLLRDYVKNPLEVQDTVNRIFDNEELRNEFYEMLAHQIKTQRHVYEDRKKLLKIIEDIREKIILSKQTIEEDVEEIFKQHQRVNDFSNETLGQNFSDIGDDNVSFSRSFNSYVDSALEDEEHQAMLNETWQRIYSEKTVPLRHHVQHIKDLMQKGEEYIHNKSNAKVFNELKKDTSMSDYDKLAVLIALGLRQSPSNRTTGFVNKLTKAINMITNEAGTTLRLMRELFIDMDTHTARMMAIEELSQPSDKDKENAKKVLRQIAKDVPRQEKKFVENIGEDGIAEIVREAMTDGTVLRESSELSAEKLMKNLVRSTVASAIREVFSKNKPQQPNTMFSSSETNAPTAGDDIVGYIEEIASNILFEDMSYLCEQKHTDFVNAILSVLKKTHATTWSALSKEAKDKLENNIALSVLYMRAKIWPVIQSVIQEEREGKEEILPGISEVIDEINEADAQGTEEGRLVSRFVKMIESYAADHPDEITPMKDEETAAAILTALMSKIKEDVLVDAGKRNASLRKQYNAIERLQQIANNVDLAREIWQRAQAIVGDMEKLADKAQDFISTILNNPFARREIMEALSLFLEHSNEKDMPKLFKKANGRFAERLANIRDTIIHARISEQSGATVTNEMIQESVDQVACLFANEVFHNTKMDKALVDGLAATTRDLLEDEIYLKAQHIIDNQQEAQNLGNSIIQKIAGAKISPNSNTANVYRTIIQAMQMFGILPKKHDPNTKAVFEQLQLQLTAKDINREIVRETIRQLEVALEEASKVDAPPFLRNMYSELASLIVSIRESSKFKKWLKSDGILQATIDKAINTILREGSKGNEPIHVTIRKIVYSNYRNMQFYANRIAKEVAARTNLPEGLCKILVHNVEKRFIERFLKTRKQELNTLLKRQTTMSKHLEDKLERVLTRIHLGALETPETTNLLARFIGAHKISEEDKERLRQLSLAIEERGFIVNRKRHDVLFKSPDDLWYNSAERRIMLRQFNNELNKVRGYTNIEKAAAWYFAMLLSGLTVQEVNTISTMLQTVAHVSARAFANYVIEPLRNRHAPDFRGMINAIAAMFKGMKQSMFDDVNVIVRTGQIYGPRISEASASKHPLLAEQDLIKNKFLATILKAFRVFARAALASDTVMANGSYWGLQQMLARNQAMEMGLSGSDVEIAEKIIMAVNLHRSSRFNLATADGVNELTRELRKLKGKITASDYAKLHNSILGANRFAEQSFYELKGDIPFTEENIEKLTKDEKIKFYKRIEELQFEALPEDIKNEHIRNAGEATFNFSTHDFYDNTFIGRITKSVLTVRHDVPLFQFVIPFVRIVGRALDMSLDYSFLGLIRAEKMKALMLDETSNVKFTQLDVDTMRAKALFGLVSSTTLFVMAACSLLDDDDDNDWFQITARGPADRRLANILREGKGVGFQESSIRIGNKWYSYKYTPLLVPLSLIGSIMDVLRYDLRLREYKKMSPQEQKLVHERWNNELMKAFGAGIIRTLPLLFEQSYMNSMTEVMEILTTPNEEERSNKFGRLFARLSTGFVVPNFFKQLNRTFDPSLYAIPENMNTFIGNVLRDIPMPAAWKGNILLRRYNVLGEPIRLTSPSSFSSLLEIMFREKENKPLNIGRFVTIGEKSDKVWTWIAENNIVVPSVTANEMLLGIPMTDELRQKYAIYRGRLLKNVLEYYIDNHQVDNLPADKAQKFVDIIARNVSGTVKAVMVANPYDVHELVQNRRVEIWKRYGLLLQDQK